MGNAQASHGVASAMDLEAVRGLTRELRRLVAAVTIATVRGGHYPLCQRCGTFAEGLAYQRSQLLCAGCAAKEGEKLEATPVALPRYLREAYEAALRALAEAP